MPQNHSLIEDERQEFCRRLKKTRERKGITLAAIAEATKIRSSLFAGLERSDLRGWPQGLYRRAYFREYARMVDDRLDEACEDFNRLFTDEPAAANPAAPQTSHPAPAPAGDFRLILDEHWHGPRTAVPTRLLAALIDAGLVAITSGAMMLVAGIDLAVSVGAVTIAYFSLGTVIFGESPAKWIIVRREKIAAAFSEPEVETPAPAQETEHRTWISDATRVGPAPPPQLRVRFKV